MADWMTCPICEESATVTPGKYFSYLTGKTSPELPKGLGTGEWSIWGVESETLYWPCGGYGIAVDGSVWHLRDEEIPNG